MQENKQEKSPIKKRILQYLDLKGITRYTFYKESGVSRGILDQDTGISEENIARFLAYAQDISPIWVILGEGEIFNTKTPKFLTLSEGKEKGKEKSKFPKLQNSLPITEYPISDDKPEMNVADVVFKQRFSPRADRAMDVQMVPVYESPSLYSLDKLFSNSIEPTNYISIPNLPKCDGAVRMWGDKMSPELKSGDLLVYKKVKDLRSGLFLGQIYLISVELEGEEYVMVQYLEASECEESVKLVSKNERYPPKDIPLESIKALAMIKASVRYQSV